MSGQIPRLIISESTNKPYVLIIDKNGYIGEAIIEKLKDQFLIVFVTGKEVRKRENLILIYYGNKIPLVSRENYAYILTIYDGEKTTLDMLPSIVKKVNEIGAKHVFIAPVSRADSALYKLLAQGIFDKTIQIIYGEIFGHLGFGHDLLSHYIHQARYSGKIEIPGNGLQKSYPVLFDDVCLAIITIAFGNSHTSKTNYVLPKHGFTQLAISRAFQKLDPGVLVSFKKANFKETEYTLLPEGQYFFPSYALAEKLRAIDLTKKNLPTDLKEFKKIKSSIRQNNKIFFSKNINPKNKYFLLFSIILFFLTPLEEAFLSRSH